MAFGKMAFGKMAFEKMSGGLGKIPSSSIGLYRDLEEF